MVEAKLNQMLLDNAEVAAIIGARLYPLVVPAGGTVPAITYVVVADDPEEHMDGASGLAILQIQYEARVAEEPAGGGYPEARALTLAIRKALLGKSWESGNVRIEAITGGGIRTETPENESSMWRTFAEFEVVARIT